MGLTGRINGWKAIGAHFGRDRTTAIRWARDRGLPVHRLPGGKTSSVYAFKDELDLWARGQEPDAVADAAPDASPPTNGTAPPPRNGRHWIVAGVLCAVLGAPVALYLARATPPSITTPTGSALPRDAALADAYLRARDLVGERSAAGLEQAIGLLQEVNRRDPGYAPAYASLAEALLLSREFGMRRDREVFPQARTAARTAVRLAPGLAEAHRALGFIAYWSDHDRAAAGAAFRRSIQLDPTQPLTRFWYGNILSDNGDHEAARRELDAARLGQPGSIAIQTDLAWAQWAAGDEAGVAPVLERLARQHPDFAVVYDCLSIIRLAQGDYDGYVEAVDRFAQAREAPALIAYARDLRAARDEGTATLRRVMMDKALTDLESDGDMTRAWASFLASVAGDRPALLHLLRTADRRREIWGDAGLVRRMQARWAGDREIRDLIDRRQGPRIA